MMLQHLIRPSKTLSAISLVLTIGCTGVSADGPGTDGPGTGGGVVQGGAGGSGGAAGGNGGAAGGLVDCDCSLASLGCGSALEQAAAAAACEIPLLPDHAGDLLACTDGAWSVQEVCAAGCEVGEAQAPDACTPTLPSISMENLVVQAQVEPFRGDQPALAGDVDVELMQLALVDEGYAVGVDGWFGNETAAQYADWQVSLGYSGIGANGVPGPTSLAELGIDRFVIDNQIIVGSQTTYQGRTVNERTRDMLAEAQSMLGHTFNLSQGSYNAGGVGASAGTHDGGGAVDISGSVLSTTQRWETVQALRRVGFAAWLRTPSQGFPYHVHAIAVGDTDMSVSARNQVADYYVGKNGLASHADDNTPVAYQVPFTWWEKYLSAN